MTDLKFEQKRSLSRSEAADQITALAAMLREGGDAELELGPGTLSLRIPDDLRGEIEVEVGNGQIELEIEFKWPITPSQTAPPHTVAGTEKTPRRKTVAAAKPDRNSTGTSRSRSAKRSTTKTP
ncbi:amphi-Trp domain-containing protein [Streptomyces sp. KS 21]|uniref:amphi-Trp domain-containing protein n=1 Tax=Streptomyces sp. KS 21 TaxID=2485150 RepID=UPI001062EDA3|nr:amphi-Trp domain-containing protein [Streptomyces sp. KS 21]TDU80576.1 amphi-Trp domain-containing protein [Streptomyces sp. KS 21]